MNIRNILKSSVALAITIALTLPVVSAEYGKIINDSDQAIGEAKTKIKKSKTVVKKKQETGQFTPEGPATASASTTKTTSAPESSSYSSSYAGNQSSTGSNNYQSGAASSNYYGGTMASSSASAQGTAAQEGKIYQKDGIIYVNMKTAFALGSKDDQNEYESGVDYIEYKIDEGPYIKYDKPFSLSSPGEHIIKYRAIDKVGNLESEKVYKVIVDDTVPKVMLKPSDELFVKGSKKYAPASYTYTLDATDSESGVAKIEYSLNGSGMQTYNGPLQPTQNGPQKLVVVAYDNVGNASGQYVYEWEIDNIKPKAFINIYPVPKFKNGKAYVNFKSKFNITGSDQESGLKGLYYSIDDGAWQKYNGPIAFSQEKTFGMKVKAVDNVGNESEVGNQPLSGDENGQTLQPGNTVTFQVDKLPPVTEITPITSDNQ